MTGISKLGMPVPLVGDPGDVVTLRSLLEKAYGTEAVASFAEIHISYVSAAPYKNYSYWDPDDTSVTRVLNGGTAIAPGRTLTITSPGELDAVSLRAGNLIYSNVEICIATSDDTVQRLQLKTVPTALVTQDHFDGIVTAADIVAAARRLATEFHGVPNKDDCHYIADTIASLAGAVLPALSGSLDPSQNEDGGFWRVVHRGSDDPDPGWQSRLQAGDIVRMEFANEKHHHTFTVTSEVNGPGRIEVVDNGGNKIWEHWRELESQSDPSTVTIYRVTPDSLYLTQGTSQGETLHGTVWSDDLRGAGGDDVLFGGTGNDRIDGGLGRDAMTGGSGNDIYIVDDRHDRVFEARDQGQDRVMASASFALAGRHVEDLTLTGTGTINGSGNSLDNTIFGNGADNTLRGGGGRDSLNGGAGNDTLVGGAGDDALTGGMGADLFRFEVRSGNDSVTDFRFGQGDRIDLMGQTYSIHQTSNGNALLELSGGGSIQLQGISPDHVESGFFTV